MLEFLAALVLALSLSTTGEPDPPDVRGDQPPPSVRGDQPPPGALSASIPQEPIIIGGGG
jgi:hypothetical protein